MGLDLMGDNTIYPTYHAHGRRILDIGGGPVSLLLKTAYATRAVVADPGTYPNWVMRRYEEVGIEYLKIAGEDCVATGEFDEVWIYNVLEHVMDPARVIQNALVAAPVLRLFEWIDPIPDDYHASLHPTHLSAAELDLWTGGRGTVEPGLKLNPTNNELPGTAYYGVFERKRNVAKGRRHVSDVLLPTVEATPVNDSSTTGAEVCPMCGVGLIVGGYDG
jgi:hypothetical protein